MRAIRDRAGRLGATLQGWGAQFRDLNPDLRAAGQWPLLPRLAVAAVLAGLALGLAWWAAVQPAAEILAAEQAREPQLQADHRRKLAQAVNLDSLRRQKAQVEEYVNQLEKQLPGKAEMDALLSDINQAGLGRGLQFELFRPGTLVLRPHHAELPISLRITGRYHDIGAFAADIASLSRIVTLHNLSLETPAGAAAAAQPGILTLDAVARTYRYLDEAELEAQRQAARKAAEAGKRR